MICFLGDIHFNASKDYFRAICEAFLEWFNNWELNHPTNTLVLAGDLVQDSVNGGVVVRYLERFFQYSRFKEVHIVVGNHDLKKVHNISQLAYDFYKDKPNFYVYEEASEVDIDGYKALFLPYFLGVNKEGLSMSEYYSNIHNNSSFSNNYDFVVGHFCGPDNAFPGAIDCIENLEKLSGRVCLGHIHTRHINPNRYLGSIYANHKNENDSKRAVWILDEGTWREERLPIFNEFITVNYPDDLPESNAIVPIYTILNCNSEATARDRYGDVFFRKTTVSNTDSNKSFDDLDVQFSNIKGINILNLFDDFAKSQSLDPTIISKCKSFLQ